MRHVRRREQLPSEGGDGGRHRHLRHRRRLVTARRAAAARTSRTTDGWRTRRTGRSAIRRWRLHGDPTSTAPGGNRAQRETDRTLPALEGDDATSTSRAAPTASTSPRATRAQRQPRRAARSTRHRHVGGASYIERPTGSTASSTTRTVAGEAARRIHVVWRTTDDGQRAATTLSAGQAPRSRPSLNDNRRLRHQRCWRPRGRRRAWATRPGRRRRTRSRARASTPSRLTFADNAGNTGEASLFVNVASAAHRPDRHPDVLAHRARQLGHRA